VVDKSTQIPLNGASIILLNSDPLKGTSTNFAGEFRLDDVPVGWQSIAEIGEVIIRPESGKEQPLNEMAVISARSFSTEETERYAGSIGDPSRMASNFAGVSTLSDQQNVIVIRGNSPMGLLLRLDGADIPNPNHFASLGTTGGGLSMINNNTLSNSDFFTGAFPAEYGNVLSGVFDLKMRNGNDENFEFTVQAGELYQLIRGEQHH
jgi:hypothetical protein